MRILPFVSGLLLASALLRATGSGGAGSAEAESPAEPLPAAGPIMLQTHGGEIRWKNIFVRAISDKEKAAAP